MHHLRPIAVLVLAAFALISGVCGCSASAGPKYMVRGQVLDEAGLPVPGVTVRVQEHRPTWPPTINDSRVTVETTDGDGRFSIDSKGSLHLYVGADGFHWETLSLSASNSDGLEPVMTKTSDRPGDFLVAWPDLRIVLTRKREVTQPDHRAFTLALSVDGSGSVFVFDPQDRTLPLHRGPEVAGVRPLPDVAPMHPLGEPGIKVEAR